MPYFEKLPSGEPFPFNYSSARIDRNALFAINQCFPKSNVGVARTKYHRSRMDFLSLKEDLMKYDIIPAHKIKDPIYDMILLSVEKDLALPRNLVIPITTGAVIQHPDFPSAKSPGLPHKIEGFKNKKEAVEDDKTRKDIVKTWYYIEANIPVNLPDVAAYGRAHLCSRDKNKIRATWGFPLSVYLAEGAYFYPLLEVLKTSQQPYLAYGLEMANGGMSYIHDMHLRNKHLPILVGDWSSFDKTIPAWLIRDAFKIISKCFDWNHVMDSEGKLWPVRPWRSNRRWRKIIDYFINTPVRLSNGERFMKHHGVPSGSCFTNVIDSIVNMIVMRYLIYRHTSELPAGEVYLGDDSLIILPQRISIDRFAHDALRFFGMKFNSDKSYQTLDPSLIHFLGYYNENGQPVKPIDTIIASTIYPEHTVTNRIDTISRLLGQAYSTLDPFWASKFIRAAHILRIEEGLTEQQVDDYVFDNPSRFKYLQTIGIDARTISLPPDPGDLYFRVLPGSCRFCWKPTSRDLNELYQQSLLI